MSRTRPVIRPKYRLTQWLDTRTNTSVFGIQARVKKGLTFKWMHCSLNGKLLLYTDEALAQRHLAWLKSPEETRGEWEGNQQLQTA